MTGDFQSCHVLSQIQIMNTLDAAQTWHNLGIATIPVKMKDKRPALSAWKSYQSRLPMPHELQTWFGSGRLNIAVLTGWRGLVVIDFDDLWRYSYWLSRLPQSLALIVLSTYRVQTRRGWHLYFYSRTPAQSWPGDGVDVKAAGGYVLAPPSIHPTGHVYSAIGRSEMIQQISSVSELLPEYRDAPELARPSLTHRELDPYDDAMRDETGTSVAEIKAKLSFADLLGTHHKNGRIWHALCPFHGDTNPSFAVYPDGHAHCHACGWHGDALDAFTEMNNLTIADAMRELSQKGIGHG